MSSDTIVGYRILHGPDQMRHCLYNGTPQPIIPKGAYTYTSPYFSSFQNRTQNSWEAVIVMSSRQYTDGATPGGVDAPTNLMYSRNSFSFTMSLKQNFQLCSYLLLVATRRSGTSTNERYRSTGGRCTADQAFPHESLALRPRIHISFVPISIPTSLDSRFYC